MLPVTRHEQKEATRHRLVDGALELFARKGILGTTTADIAKTIGMSHGVVFLHFAKRDDLVIAVIDEFGRRLAAELRDTLRGPVGMRDILSLHLQVLAEFEPFYARLVTEAPLLPEKVRSTLLMLQASVSGWITAAHQREVEAGTARPFPRALLFNTWIGLVHHYLANRDVFATGESVIGEQGDALVEHFMKLVSV
jgi:AcrR family transcriptional regulator